LCLYVVLFFLWLICRLTHPDIKQEVKQITAIVAVPQYQQ